MRKRHGENDVYSPSPVHFHWVLSYDRWQWLNSEDSNVSQVCCTWRSCLYTQITRILQYYLETGEMDVTHDTNTLLISSELFIRKGDGCLDQPQVLGEFSTLLNWIPISKCLSIKLNITTLKFFSINKVNPQISPLSSEKRADQSQSILKHFQLSRVAQQDVKNVGNSSIQYWTPTFSPPSDDKRIRPRDYKTKTWPELTPQAEQYDL